MTMTHFAAQQRTRRRATADAAAGKQRTPPIAEFSAELCARCPIVKALPPEDVMTTTAVRAPRAVPHRCGDVLNESFRVAPRHGGDPPRKEDALRVGVMRRITAARLRYFRLEALHDDVMLIVSELLTNALLHSGPTKITLTITIENGLVREGAAQPGQEHPHRLVIVGGPTAQ